MRKYLWYGLIVASVFCCKNSGVDKKEEGLKYMETIVINDVPKATLTFYNVEDSRCPEGATCIWAGVASVDLLLAGFTTEGGVREHVKMCPGDCGDQFGKDTLVKKFAGEEYLLILEDVKPYPKMSEEHKKEDYTILLKIEKK